MKFLICQISDTESSITLSMYLGVKWEDSRIFNMNISIEDLQGVGFPFLSFLWQPDIEIHHIRRVSEPKVMGQFLAGLQINRGVRREVLLSQVTLVLIDCSEGSVQSSLSRSSSPLSPVPWGSSTILSTRQLVKILRYSRKLPNPLPSHGNFETFWKISLSWPFSQHTCPILFGSYTWDFNYLTFHIDNSYLTR